MTEVLKVRDSDGRVVGHFPDADTAAAWAEAGYTLRELAEGETYDPARVYTIQSNILTEDVVPLQQSKKDELAAYRDEVVLATVSTDFGTFYTDDKSRILMLGQLLGVLIAERAGQPVPTTVMFKTVEDGFKTFATEDFMAAALQVLSEIEAAFETQAALETEVNGLTDPAAIGAVVWAQ